ncbi:MAG: ferrochelatase [Acidobacteria bacterium]|nr:ferrochelatase [Acidobacteriota bacterium]
MSEAAQSAVLLLAHGSPDSPDDVPEFMNSITGGRAVSAETIQEIQHRYARMGRSPLLEITLRQAAALQRELKMPVYTGMRNWKPYITDAVREMAQAGVERGVVICLAPQNSRTSVGLYRRALNEANPTFDVDFVESWHDHPLLVRAFAEKLAAAWPRTCEELGARTPVVFTAHSVPERTINGGDPYADQARATAALVAMQVSALTVDDWTFAFQSQGRSGGPWIGPTVEETLQGLRAKSHRGVLIQPIGFVCDHVEVLHDIDVCFQEFATQQGMKLWRTESLNDSPTFIAALADVARSRLLPAGEKPSLVQIAPK